AAQEALTIRRRLAKARPDAFEPYLAMSLNNLGNMLSELGRREDALDAAREAAEVLWPHTMRLPGGFDAWLKVIAANYVRRCEEAGVDPDEALLTRIGEALRNTPG
ncbi:tetratricopeptide repeat protein, partial [Candidatus Binatia bacterium]|nr:tetratricopeptide repeat protein [Candidatus Binatia bacterium]